MHNKFALPPYLQYTPVLHLHKGQGLQHAHQSRRPDKQSGTRHDVSSLVKEPFPVFSPTFIELHGFMQSVLFLCVLTSFLDRDVQSDGQDQMTRS